MTQNIEAFQLLLAKMRDEFIGEIPERCAALDDLILKLENSPADLNVFNELYRGVHSLKGSGGTHGLSIVTTICHQLENLLTEVEKKKSFGAAVASQALSYVDLLRQVEKIAHDENQNFSAIESALIVLRNAGLRSRKTGLIAEASSMMGQFYQHALEDLPLQVRIVDNGLVALERLLHEPFDFVIVGRELKELNGVALMVALRESNTRNANIPAIFISTKVDAVPAHAAFGAVLARDKQLPVNLKAAVQLILHS